MRSAARRYELRTGSQPEVLKAHTELSTLLNDALVLEQEKRLAEAGLNTALARPVEEAFAMIPEEPPDQPLFTNAQLEPLVLEARPDVQGRRALVRPAGAEASLRGTVLPRAGGEVHVHGVLRSSLRLRRLAEADPR